jgi:MFS family permease
MWMKELDRTERRTMLACFLGWTLDALDVQVYSFVIPTLLAAWSISMGQAGVLGTVALLASAVGGWTCGILSDRYGRVRILQLVILWYAFFTFLSGFTQNFEQLFICRALQGFGFGGEWATGAVLIGETVRSQYRGRAVGFVQSGWAIGWGLATLLFGLFFSIFPDHVAWRALFWVGLLPALLVFWVRGHVGESEIFLRRRAQAGASRSRIFAIFHPDHLATTVKITTFVTGVKGANYSLLIWLPTYLKKVRGLSVVGTTGFTIVMILGSLFGFLAGAYLADAIGRKRTFFVSALGSAAMLSIYMLVPLDNQAILLLGIPLGLFSNMMLSPMGPFMTELFPTRMRAAGQGFCYNFGAAVGAIFPALVGALSSVMGMGNAIVVFGVAGYSLMVIGILMLPETLGRPLMDDPEPPRAISHDPVGYTPES